METAICLSAENHTLLNDSSTIRKGLAVQISADFCRGSYNMYNASKIGTGLVVLCEFVSKNYFSRGFGIGIVGRGQAYKYNAFELTYGDMINLGNGNVYDTDEEKIPSKIYASITQNYLQLPFYFQNSSKVDKKINATFGVAFMPLIYLYTTGLGYNVNTDGSAVLARQKLKYYGPDNRFNFAIRPSVGIEKRFANSKKLMRIELNGMYCFIPTKHYTSDKIPNLLWSVGLQATILKF
jgi:hypothetical protein